MRNWILAAGVAALAIAAPASAGPGGGHGGHGGQAKGNHGAGHKAGGGGHGPSMKAHGQSARRGGGGQDHGAMARKIDRSPQVRHARSDKPMKARHAGKSATRNDFKQAERRIDRVRDNRRIVVRDRHEDRFDARFSPRRLAGLADGCPPGLAAKHNGCLPPGQAKKLVGAALPAAYLSHTLDGPFGAWYPDTDRYLYRAGDNYLYRVDRSNNLVDALIPYGIDDFSYYPVGYTYPDAYNYYNVPAQYRGLYPDSGVSLYRYGNGAIYQLDPRTNAIQSIVSLLAGDLAVGQRLPPSYGVYNVPLSYRDRYYDTPDDWYRYNDGYIYRVDPTTQLVTAVINALV